MSGFFKPDQVSIDALAPELQPLRDMVGRLLQGQLQAGPQQHPNLYPGLPSPMQQLYGVSPAQQPAGSFYNAPGGFVPSATPSPLLTGSQPPQGPTLPGQPPPQPQPSPVLDPNLLMGTGQRGTFGTDASSFGPFQPLAGPSPITSGSRYNFTPSYQNQATSPTSFLQAAFDPNSFYPSNQSNPYGGGVPPLPPGDDPGDIQPPDDDQDTTDGGDTPPATGGGNRFLPGDPFSGSLDLAQFGGPFSAPLLGGQLDALQGLNALFNPSPIVQNQDMQSALFRSLSGDPVFNPNLGASFGSTVAPFDIRSAADPFFASLFGQAPGPTQYQPYSNPFFNPLTPSPFTPGSGGLGFGALPPGSVGGGSSPPAATGGSPAPMLAAAPDVAGAGTGGGQGGATSGFAGVQGLTPQQLQTAIDHSGLGNPNDPSIFTMFQQDPTQFSPGQTSAIINAANQIQAPDPTTVQGAISSGIPNEVVDLASMSKEFGIPISSMLGKGTYSNFDGSVFDDPAIQQWLQGFGVQYRQQGGDLDPNAFTVVGEAGPEVIPPGNNQVVPMAGHGAFMPSSPGFFNPQSASQFTDAVLPTFTSSFATALQAPRFDLTGTFRAGERVFARDLEDQLANVREEFSGLGLGPGSTDRENRLLRTAGDSTARFRLGQLGLGQQSFENAEGRRIAALGAGPGVASVMELPFQRRLQALPALMQREQQAVNNFFDVANPAAQQRLSTLGLLPGFSNLPFQQGSNLYQLNEMARLTADTDLMRRLAEFSRTQGGLLNQIIGLFGGTPPMNTALGPSLFSQLGSFIGNAASLPFLPGA